MIELFKIKTEEEFTDSKIKSYLNIRPVFKDVPYTSDKRPISISLPIYRDLKDNILEALDKEIGLLKITKGDLNYEDLKKIYKAYHKILIESDKTQVERQLNTSFIGLQPWILIAINEKDKDIFDSLKRNYPDAFYYDLFELQKINELYTYDYDVIKDFVKNTSNLLNELLSDKEKGEFLEVYIKRVFESGKFIEKEHIAEINKTILFMYGLSASEDANKIYDLLRSIYVDKGYFRYIANYINEKIDYNTNRYDFLRSVLSRDYLLNIGRTNEILSSVSRFIEEEKFIEDLIYEIYKYVEMSGKDKLDLMKSFSFPRKLIDKNTEMFNRYLIAYSQGYLFNKFPTKITRRNFISDFIEDIFVTFKYRREFYPSLQDIKYLPLALNYFLERNNDLNFRKKVLERILNNYKSFKYDKSRDYRGKEFTSLVLDEIGKLILRDKKLESIYSEYNMKKKLENTRRFIIENSI